MEFKKSNRHGFTLAEVLITLAIIGIVAALTIPTVVKNYQKQQTVVKLKKSYSELANAANLAIAEYGPISEWDISDEQSFSSETSTKFMDTYVLPYLKVSKNCGTKTCTKFFRKDLKGSFSNIYQFPNDTRIAKIILNDGTFIYLWVLGAKASLAFDINGENPPNIWGKDVFQFDYCKTCKKSFGLAGIENNRESIISAPGEGCNKTATNVAGRYCGALIQFDGWKISDDYPW